MGMPDHIHWTSFPEGISYPIYNAPIVPITIYYEGYHCSESNKFECLNGILDKL